MRSTWLVIFLIASPALHAMTESSRQFLRNVRHNHIEEVKAFLQQDAKAIQEHVITKAFSYAVYRGHYRITKLLIEANANLNVQTTGPFSTPLLVAIYKHHTNIARLLIKKGADINRPDEFGCTPLIAACQYNSKVSLIKELLQNNADMDARERVRNCNALDLVSPIHPNLLSISSLFKDEREKRRLSQELIHRNNFRVFPYLQQKNPELLSCKALTTMQRK